MAKSEGRKSASQDTSENGMENPGLELMEVGNLEQGKTLEEVTQGHSLKDGLGHSSLWRRILQPFTKARSFYQRHAGLFKKILLGLLCLAYAAYLLAACILNFRRALALFVITCLVIFILACHFLKKFFAKKSIRCLKPLKNTRLRLWLKRTEPGFNAFQWLGDQIQSLPIIIFFGFVMSILYYLGLVQWVIQKNTWLLQITMGTTAAETLAVAGNIFVGMYLAERHQHGFFLRPREDKESSLRNLANCCYLYTSTVCA